MRKLVRWILYGTAAFYSFCALSLMALRFCDPLFTIVHLQRQIEALFNAGGYAKQYAFVPLSRISDHLEHAVIAAEDSRFFHHYGIDWQEFRNALHANWQRGQFWRGGSTITQQLVKNLFLSTYGSVLRKALELTLAPLANLLLPKERVLELYLNVIEWGPGVYGVEAAARYHYGMPAARLSREQAARLAACLPAPLLRRPQHMDHVSADILGRMRQMGW